MPLSDNAAVVLTTAHFYTPQRSRLIQRDYSNISFLDYYTHTNLDQKNVADVKMTDSGLDTAFTVVAASLPMSISPAAFTPTRPIRIARLGRYQLNKFQIEILRKQTLYDFFGQCSSDHVPTTLFPRRWEPDQAVLTQFHDFLTKDKVTFTEAEFNDNRQWLKQTSSSGEMYITAFTFEDSQRVAIEQDPMEVAKAIDSLPKAKELLDNAKKLLVERVTKTAGPAALSVRRH